MNICNFVYSLLHSAKWLILISCMMPFVASQTFGQSRNGCSRNGIDYQNDNFIVSKIVVHTPLSLLGSTKQAVEDAIDSAANGLKVNEPFTLPKETATQQAIDQMTVIRNQDNEAAVVAPTAAFPRRRNCSETARTIEIHYFVYMLEIGKNILPSSKSTTKIRRATPATSVSSNIAKLNPRFFIDYNRSRNIYGGGEIRLPLKTAILDEISLSGTASSSSAAGRGSFKGSHEFSSDLMETLEWSGGYSYSNIPAKVNKLKEGYGYGQTIATGRSRGKFNFVPRYGVIVEAGNKQTDFDPLPASPELLTGSGYTALKSFIGFAASSENQALDISYGLELGKTANANGKYNKQIIDIGYSLGIIPKQHYPIDIETRFNAGTLKRVGSVPLPTRFFGGNVQKNFLNNNEWVIRDNPYIRSFPENSFIPNGQNSPLGGDKFLAFNLTLAATFYARPLVPPDIIDAGDYKFALNETIAAAKSTLFETYLLKKSPALRDFASDTLKIRDSLVSAANTIEKLKTIIPTGEIDYTDLSQNLCLTGFTLNQIELTLKKKNTDLQACGKKAKKDNKILVWLDTLYLADPSFPKLIRSDLYELICSLRLFVKDLKASGKPVQQEIDALNAVISKLEAARTNACKYSCLRDGNTDRTKNDGNPTLSNCDTGTIDNIPPLCPNSCSLYLDAETLASLPGVRQDALDEAQKTTAEAEKLINRLVKKENLFAFGPVFMFDAAKIAEQSQPFRSVPARYGVGLGGRFTIVGLKADIGYSFNPGRRNLEQRGAFVFTLNFSDLLR